MHRRLRYCSLAQREKWKWRKYRRQALISRELDIEGFNRSSLIKNIGLPFKIVKSFFQVRSIIKHFRPDAVIGVGGYSSFPVLRYAQAKGIPTFIHEANSFAGKSNILLGKKASKVFVATDGMEKFFPANKIMITGIRYVLLLLSNYESRGKHEFILDWTHLKKQCLLRVEAWVQKELMKRLESKLIEFEKNDVQLIWQTGKPFAEKAKAQAAGKKNIWTNDFITQMEYAYAAADIVISRAGAMTIAELCVVKKPVVFVPFPFAAEDHQTANAQNLVNQKGGIDDKRQ